MDAARNLNTNVNNLTLAERLLVSERPQTKVIPVRGPEVARASVQFCQLRLRDAFVGHIYLQQQNLVFILPADAARPDAKLIAS